MSFLTPRLCNFDTILNVELGTFIVACQRARSSVAEDILRKSSETVGFN